MRPNSLILEGCSRRVSSYHRNRSAFLRLALIYRALALAISRRRFGSRTAACSSSCLVIGRIYGTVHHERSVTKSYCLCTLRINQEVTPHDLDASMRHPDAQEKIASIILTSAWTEPDPTVRAVMWEPLLTYLRCTPKSHVTRARNWG